MSDKSTVTLFDSDWNVRKISHPRLGDGFEIDMTAMYSPPVEMSFSNMKVISDYFGTENIDVDNVSESGCETCDYGSNYGHEVQVYGATKNNPF